MTRNYIFGVTSLLRQLLDESYRIPHQVDFMLDNLAEKSFECQVMRCPCVSAKSSKRKVSGWVKSFMLVCWQSSLESFCSENKLYKKF